MITNLHLEKLLTFAHVSVVKFLSVLVEKSLADQVP